MQIPGGGEEANTEILAFDFAQARMTRWRTVRGMVDLGCAGPYAT